MRPTERFFIYAALALAVVIAAGGRLAQGDALAQDGDAGKNADRPIAVCDLVSVVEKLMESDRYRPAREEAQLAAEEKMRPFREAAMAAEAKARNTPQDDPTFPDLIRDLQRMQAEYQQAFQREGAELEKMTVSQISEAYEIARASAEDIAGDLGYDYLIASRDPTKPIEAPDVAGAVRTMLARPVVKSPKDADITEDVLADLKLN
ncbi:MAG: OmpH family outer membrane protein [Phycisphaerales bacterium]|nr:OmpH family outer membrane protein [Phycisphaerales bacterium]